MHPALQRFEAPVRDWFRSRFSDPSPPQALGWPSIADGNHTLILAPTGSGKTLAAFLWSINVLYRDLPLGAVEPGVHTLYISPLKALSYDIEKNLGEPLVGIRKAAQQLGRPVLDISLAVRTGDTPSSERAAMLRKPPHILITTPESFFLILSSPKARDILRTVRYVIVDEIHAVCGNKRGAHLALSLERLVHLAGRDVVRIGLSATQRPVEEVARFLGGCQVPGVESEPGYVTAMEHPSLLEAVDLGKGTALREPPVFRPVNIIDTGLRKSLDLRVISPVPDFSVLPQGTVWPALYPKLIDLIRSHRSTLVFVRMRAQSERISNDINELVGEPLARAHHGSISRPVRRELERLLKAGELRALVATGTLELGIDVGAIDLVVQIQSPGSVTRGLQRVGRAGHLLEAHSAGRLLATYREDLLESAVIARRMRDGQVEALRVPRNALDILAQHLAAAVCLEEWNSLDLLALVRRAYPYHSLTPDLFQSVLELLSGRKAIPAATRTRTWITWDRASGLLRGLTGSLPGILRHAGTIPDQGYYGLYLVDNQTRLGELEEEFVYEIQTGDVIQFGNSTWLVEEIDRERVLVRPAHGQPGRVPFWKGGLFGRDPELSEAVGAFRRELVERLGDPEVTSWLREQTALDDWAADALVAYFKVQTESEGAVPTDRTIVVEHFLDEIGDHRVAILTTFGSRVNAPLAMALRRLLRQHLGLDPQVMYDDNAILLRTPAGDAPPPVDILSRVTSRQMEDLVVGELAETPMFGAIFRQNAARFLVLTGRTAGRTPLWLQRLRSRDLLEAVRTQADYPVTLETYRECLQDVMDLASLQRLLERIESGQVRLVYRDVDYPSPMAAGAVYRFMDAFMYQYDEPKAERRLRGLSLNRELLAQMLGRGELLDLLEPSVIRELEDEWQGRSPWTRARDADELFGLLVTIGDLPYSPAEPNCVASRCEGQGDAWVEQLLQDGRTCLVRTLDHDRLVPVEGLDLLRLAFFPAAVEILRGREPTPPLHQELSPAQAREERVLRAISRLGPGTPQDLVELVGLPPSTIGDLLDRLAAQGEVYRGRFLPGKPTPQYCTRSNLEAIHRRSLVYLRKQVEPCSLAVFQQFLLHHQHVVPNRRLRGEEGLFTLVEQLGGRLLPAEILEREVLGLRFQEYHQEWLTRLVGSGEVVWSGLPSNSGRRRRVALYFAEDRELFFGATWPSGREPQQPTHTEEPGPDEPTYQAVRSALQRRGASFVPDLLAETGLDLPHILECLWEMVWLGEVTNDSFDTLRTAIANGFRVPQSTINPLTGRPSQFRTGLHAIHRSHGRHLHHRPTSSGRWWLIASPAERPSRERAPFPSRGDGRGSQTRRRGEVEPYPGHHVAANRAGEQEDPAERLTWQLLARYGVLSRDLSVAEDLPLSWGDLYRTLERLEMIGQVRRGFFVEGLSGAQFALPEAVNELRDLRTTLRDEPTVLLNACDPALLPTIQRTNAAPWPYDEGFSRVPTAFLAIESGQISLWAERDCRNLHFHPAADQAARRRAIQALVELTRRPPAWRPFRRLEVETIDGQPAVRSSFQGDLEAVGFEPRGSLLVYRPVG